MPSLPAFRFSPGSALACNVLYAGVLALVSFAAALAGSAAVFAPASASAPSHPVPSAPIPKATALSAQVAPPAPFAVVELFTSEGCSSCPPADQLLAELAGDAERSGHGVFALSFHVDYWNRLGWEDPFSRAEFSQRQERYARALQARMYTPQMIVNGGEEFVGSNAASAREAIASALSRSAAVSVALPEVARDAAGWRVRFSVTGHKPGDLLNVALVEKGLSVPVQRGENGGRTLKHENVVRAFSTVLLNADGSGTLKLAMPAQAAPGKTFLIAYAQRAESWRVIGAMRMALPAPAP